MRKGRFGKKSGIKNFRNLTGKLGSLLPRWGVPIYNSVSDLNVTIVQPGDMNFRPRTTFTKLKFFIVRFACVKNFAFNFLVF